MNDSQRIQMLEEQLADIQTELANLSLAVSELSRSADTRRESIQSAVDDLQNSVQLIFGLVHVPNVIYRPDRHIIID